MNYLKKLLVGTICMTCLVSNVFSTSLMEEITVTAQKREQNIQDVGIAITAFSGEQLDKVGVTKTTDLVAITPGLQNPRGGGGYTSSFSIRGLSQSDFGASQEAPVALYVDEVYISSQGMGEAIIFDIERAEVLRGPQGTLFGRNATGGLVHFITRKPTREFEGYGEITFGSYDQIDFEGAISGPLNKTVSARASVSVDTHDGVIKNRIGRDGWNAENYAGRIQLLFEPNEDLSALINVHGAIKDGRTGFYDHEVSFPTGLQGNGETAPPGSVDFLGFREPDNDPFTVSHDAPVFHDTDAYGITGTVTWELENFTVTSISDYTDYKSDFLEDSDMQPGEYFHFFGKQDLEQFSQELRFNGELERVRWTTGFYYLNIEGVYQQGGLITDLGFGVGSQDTDWSLDTESWSLFGQIEFDINDKFTLIGGIRYISEDKEQDYVSAFKDVRNGTSIGFGPTPDLLTFSGEDDKDLYSVKAELDWHINDNNLAYFSFNRGVKAGGFNAPLDPSGSDQLINPLTFAPATTADQAMRYNEEVLYAYELGLKSTFMDGRARLNIAGFYYDYNDFQGFNLSNLTTYITNVDAELAGVDIELYVSPVDRLDLTFGLSYLDQKAKGVTLGAVNVDRKIPFAPKWNITGLARYEWPAFNGTLAIQGNFSYASDHYFFLSNAPVLKENGYFLADARVSYLTSDEKWEATFFVKNIADENYRVVALDISTFFGSTENQPGLPRWFGGSIGYRW